MEAYENEGIINYSVKGQHIPIRVQYTATKEDLKIRINYPDLVKILRATPGKNLKELDLQFTLEVRFTD